jgi:hypothetical protein
MLVIQHFTLPKKLSFIITSNLKYKCLYLGNLNNPVNFKRETTIVTTNKLINLYPLYFYHTFSPVYFVTNFESGILRHEKKCNYGVLSRFKEEEKLFDNSITDHKAVEKKT